MNSERTPHSEGPWMAAASPSSIVGWPVVGKGGRAIASVHCIMTKPADISDADWERYRAEVKSNANLIGGAPDMYAALDAFPMREREDDAHYVQRVKDWWLSKGGKAIVKAETGK